MNMHTTTGREQFVSVLINSASNDHSLGIPSEKQTGSKHKDLTTQQSADCHLDIHKEQISPTFRFYTICYKKS